MHNHPRHHADTAKETKSPRTVGPVSQGPVAPTAAADVAVIKHDIRDPRAASPRDILALQRLTGNWAVNRLLAQGVLTRQKVAGPPAHEGAAAPGSPTRARRWNGVDKSIVQNQPVAVERPAVEAPNLIPSAYSDANVVAHSAGAAAPVADSGAAAPPGERVYGMAGHPSGWVGLEGRASNKPYRVLRTTTPQVIKDDNTGVLGGDPKDRFPEKLIVWCDGEATWFGEWERGPGKIPMRQVHGYLTLKLGRRRFIVREEDVHPAYTEVEEFKGVLGDKIKKLVEIFGSLNDLIPGLILAVMGITLPVFAVGIGLTLGTLAAIIGIATLDRAVNQALRLRSPELTAMAQQGADDRLVLEYIKRKKERQKVTGSLTAVGGGIGAGVAFAALLGASAAVLFPLGIIGAGIGVILAAYAIRRKVAAPRERAGGLIREAAGVGPGSQQDAIATIQLLLGEMYGGDLDPRAVRESAELAMAREDSGLADDGAALDTSFGQAVTAAVYQETQLVSKNLYRRVLERDEAAEAIVVALLGIRPTVPGARARVPRTHDGIPKVSLRQIERAIG